MNAATQRLLSEALQLPDDEREALGLALLDAVPGHADGDTVAADWRAEVRARLSELREGRATARPWAEVEAEMRARLGSR